MASTSRKALRAIFWGGAICGVLDISSAFIIWYSRGVRLSRGLQGLASGLLGRDAAFSGGGKTAALGLAIHFTVAFSATIIFYLISRKLTFMTRQPVTSGFAYGLCVYLFMYHIIIPTFFGPRQPATRDTITAILIHLFLIGLPISLSVRRFARN
jgi:uncharacterized membrane protein YjjP (DUF1212 family)